MKNQYIASFIAQNPAEFVERVSAVENTGLLLVFFGADFNYRDLFYRLLPLNIPFIGCMDTGRLLDGQYHLETDSVAGMTISREVLEKVVVTAHPMKAGLSYETVGALAEAAFDDALARAGVNPNSPDMERDLVINLDYGLYSANPVLEAQKKRSLFLQSLGGSSGGKLDFQKTPVISSRGMGALGVSAVVRLRPEFKYKIDLTTSFEKVALRLKADGVAGPRHITTFDGKPALQAYMEAIGKPGQAATPADFATYTLGLETGDGERLITSIMKDDGNGGLLTYNDVLPGVEFSLFRAVSQLEPRMRKLYDMDGAAMVGYISFDCVLCYLARNELREVQDVAGLYDRVLPTVPKIGFGTFSENYCGANVNQTETFLAIFRV